MQARTPDNDLGKGLGESAVILTGDALSMLKTLEANSVDCIVTSPPYWGLRDYGVTEQIGLEPTFAEFLERLVDVFEECKRVLKPSGTLWVNMGDAYAGSWGGQGGPSNLSVPVAGVNPASAPQRKGSGLAAKNLIGQPWRLAFALQDAGWILRSEIIWHKPNPMPESVCDRPTRSHEQLFLFVKSKRYFYNADAIAEPVTSTVEPKKAKPSGWANSENYDSQDPRYPSRSGQDAARAFSRKRQSLPDAYQEPIELPDHFKGSVPGRKDGPGQERRSTTRKYSDNELLDSERLGRAPGWRELEQPPTRNARTVWSIPTQPYKEAHFATFPSEIPRRCILAGCPENGVVLDPFAGSGTTIAVAMQLGRRAIGIELNPEYVKLIESRLSELTPSLFVEESA